MKPLLALLLLAAPTEGVYLGRHKAWINPSGPMCYCKDATHAAARWEPSPQDCCPDTCWALNGYPTCGGGDAGFTNT